MPAQAPRQPDPAPLDPTRPTVLDASVLDRSVLADLRATLQAADYTVDQVVSAMGQIPHAALARNHTVPAERALEGRDDALATVIRLWPLQRPVARAAVEAALPGLVDPLLRAGILAAVPVDVRTPRTWCDRRSRRRPAPVRHRGR